MKAKLVLAAALSLAACSTAPAGDTSPAPSGTATSTAAAEINPVGHYEFTTIAQEQMVTGTVDITGTPGAYRGSVSTSLTPSFPITSVGVRGRTVTVSGGGANGAGLSLEMNFSDASNFSGNWQYAGARGNLSGRRVN